MDLLRMAAQAAASGSVFSLNAGQLATTRGYSIIPGQSFGTLSPTTFRNEDVYTLMYTSDTQRRQFAIDALVAENFWSRIRITGDFSTGPPGQTITWNRSDFTWSQAGGRTFWQDTLLMDTFVVGNDYRVVIE